MHIRSRVAAALLVAATTATLSACGSSNDNSSSSSSSTPATGSSSGTNSYQSALDAAYKGNIQSPPTSGPKAAKNKNVWVISCGQQVISCSAGAKGAMDAAKAAGWKTTLYDGKFNPALFATGVSQAVAAKADGIILDAIDCAAAQGPMRQARKAGIELVGFYAFDCDDPNVGGKPVYSGQVVTQGSPNYRDAVLKWAANSADWTAAKLNGKAKVIIFKQDELLVVKYIREGFEAELKRACPGCKIVATVPITGTDVGPKLQQKTQNAILQHPDANAVYTLYDGLVLAGVGAGVKASGRAKDLVVVGGEGFAPNTDLVRSDSGEQTAGDGFPSDWTGFAAVDTMNRLFAGEKPVNSGIGWQVWDKTHNLPPSGPWVPIKDGKPVDYRAAYEKIWSGQ